VADDVPGRPEDRLTLEGSELRVVVDPGRQRAPRGRFVADVRLLGASGCGYLGLTLAPTFALWHLEAPGKDARQIGAAETFRRFAVVVLRGCQDLGPKRFHQPGQATGHGLGVHDPAASLAA
jgi:hypothetical protein